MPPQPRVVHPLPSAPDFLGREAELEQLRSFWNDNTRGVLSLVGLGGAGKTALAARFLSGPLRPDGGLFVWSFYQEPDAGLFLQELLDYFSPHVPTAASAKGAGLLHLLSAALEQGGRHLLVLDGLERVQRQAGTGDSYGQIEDPLLKSLLVRIAEGLGRTTVLVTSRFPLTDLTPWRGQGYRHLDVGELTRPAALALLRRRGVHGEDAALTALVEGYGAHALTLDHLGSLIGQFLDGDPLRAPEAPALSALSGDRQALRLSRLLAAYEKHLPPAELTLLCRLCLLRRSVNAEQLVSLFLCSPPVHARTIRDLTEQVARRTSAVPLRGVQMSNLSRVIQEVLEEALTAAPLAGPDEEFRRAVLTAVAGALELLQNEIHIDVEQLARQYAHTESPDATENHPLPPEDRKLLRYLYGQYRQLREHPLLPFKEKDPLLSAAFASLDWKPSPWPLADLGPADVLRLLRKVERLLGWLALKHQALRCVRERCRLHRQKWTLAGPLAPLDATELRQVLDALVGRHLVLREADGSFTAHPAVRDHFARLGSATERGHWHELLRQRLTSLTHQPGLAHPQDRLTLDLVEEAIYHAQQAGQSAEAVVLYEQTLGGLRHLGWKLGEMARGLRILRGFDPCPDRWALGWFLRALGEFEEAYRHNDLPYFRADVRLLQGRLPEAAHEGEDTRTTIAEFLMGRTTQPPPSVLGCAVPRAQILLYLGRLSQARQIAQLDPLYQDMGHEGERARCRLLAAEAARRQADAPACLAHLQAASGWILHSGSVEHLCLYHLMRARAAGDTGERETAQRAVHEGLHLARTCGLGLYHIELLCAQAEISLARGDAPAAEHTANEALWRATANDCRFAWGEGEARHLLGAALAAQQRIHESRTALKAACQLRERIGDPRRQETERLLATLEN
ncbi:MAG TPA: hypothetical protein VH643_20935 [Gemmataceae bacterium]|jgi:hypothetical protein